MAWLRSSVVALGVALATCAHDVGPEDLTCYATCPDCGADAICAGAGRYSSATCLRRCTLTSDCPLAQRCVLVEGTASWWDHPVYFPVCVGDDHPAHCRTAAVAGQCTDFFPACLDATHLLVPWFGQKNRICGSEVTACANGCQAEVGPFGWPAGHCR